MWPLLGRPLAALQYVMYFRFCGCRHVFYSGPYGGMTLRASLATVSRTAITPDARPQLHPVYRRQRTPRLDESRSCETEYAMHHCFLTSPPGGVRTVVMSVSVCLSFHSHNLKTTRPNFTKVLCLWLRLGPPLVAWRYVMYFRFCGCRHVFAYWARHVYS